MDEQPAALPGGWRLVSEVRNPWGQVPITADGRSLPASAKRYVESLERSAVGAETVSRRHHYVPRSYLRSWASDDRRRRIWVLDTVTRRVHELGIADVCVREDFHRVAGPDGSPHNRVEQLFGVVDSELARVCKLFRELQDPATLQFDDLIALGVTIAVQRMRTLQERRLQQQYHAWLRVQNHKQFPAVGPMDAASLHTRSLFEAMWSAADVMTMRQIEVWDDPAGRFLTCDVPVLVPFRRGAQPSLYDTPYIIWPISPFRAIALTNSLAGEKAVMRQENKLVGIVRSSVLQCRERMIFASSAQLDQLPRTKRFLRRPQSHFTCSDYTPRGEYVQPPGCCVRWGQILATKPVVNLCAQGLHNAAPALDELA